MSYIFKTEFCKKGDLYDFFINKMTAAGWQNISSNALDGDVMYSDGVNGDRKIFVQLAPINAVNYPLNQNNLNNVEYNVRTSKTSNQFSVRLCFDYTPGQNGERGVFVRPNQAFFYLTVLNIATAVHPSAVCEVIWYCDKNRLIAITKAPSVLGGNRQLLILGQMDTMYYPSADSRGTLCMGVGGNMTAPYISDYMNPDSGTIGAHQICWWMSLIIKNKMLLFEPFINIGTGIVVARIDGVYWQGYVIPDGDIIKVGDRTFKSVCITASVGSTAFDTQYVAVEVKEDEV